MDPGSRSRSLSSGGASRRPVGSLVRDDVGRIVAHLNADRFSNSVDNFGYTSAFPRRAAPEVCKNFSPKENRGRRECRVPNAPAASHAVKISTRVSHHGHTGTTRHSPRNGFTAYFALSSVTTLFDTVACASSRRLDAKDWGVGTTRLDV